jgi:octaheme c-type cytochrome (tetrathionate reductase family)
MSTWRRWPAWARTAIAGAAALAVVVATGWALSGRASARGAEAFERKIRPHFDHAAVIAGKLDTPQDVTRACLSCHPRAAVDVMRTSHWTWLGDEVAIPGREGKHRIGKKNLINNFCISTRGNERSCTKCHAGYGWADADFDFSKEENVDCLVCHERGSGYAKGLAGMPAKGVDLAAAARSVGTPGRENCLACHAFGGGGEAVKHGDLDSSLVHPPADEDVHMGEHGFLCVDCHGGPRHELRGRAFSVSVEDSNGVACTGCHADPEHRDARIDTHLRSVACQTCHVPTYARRIPTKATWDWSKAGDATRKEDPHGYLKIKGEFTYEQDVLPEYRWFRLEVNRYLAGDRIDPSKVTPINLPVGDVADPRARIWPFKIHRAKQPYDARFGYLLAPVTGGPNGYWTTFDWEDAFRRGAKASGLPYSGKHGFAETEMYWPLTHMVAPKDKALGCTDCHGEGARMDWKALGYAGDPISTGGRP